MTREAKFEHLASLYAEQALRHANVEAVTHLETIEVHELAELFTRIKRSMIA